MLFTFVYLPSLQHFAFSATVFLSVDKIVCTVDTLLFSILELNYTHICIMHFYLIFLLLKATRGLIINVHTDLYEVCFCLYMFAAADMVMVQRLRLNLINVMYWEPVLNYSQVYITKLCSINLNLLLAFAY